MTEAESNELRADMAHLKNEIASVKELLIGDGGASGIVSRLSKVEEQLLSAHNQIDSLVTTTHGDGAGVGLVPRVNKLEERSDWADQKTDDVDSMVHGDGSNSGLIASVNTLESRVNFLMFLLPIAGALLGTFLVAVVIFVSNIIIA